MELEPGQKISRFSIVRRLGQGGMSDVFLARDAENDRDVVLKFPFGETLGDVATHERFTREVKIGKLLNHPHIQHLYELAQTKNSEYMVLEFVPGDSLRHVLRDRNGHRTKDDYSIAIDLGIQIGSALGYAHTHNVAHRDLKPENVIITPDKQAKVMDFGIALLQGARRVTWGPLSSQVGTPDYMAPEQIQGSRGDARTDIYALGMILYEFLVGRLPYQGDNALAIMNQHVNAKAPPINKFRHDVPAPLEEAILKAMRRKPDDRWPSMEEFVHVLRNLDTVDVETLKAEREAEPETVAAGRGASVLGLSASPASLITAVVFVLIFALLLIAFHFFGHPGHRH